MTGSHHGPLSIATTHAMLNEVLTNTATWGAELNPNSPVIIRVGRDYFHLAQVSAEFVGGRWSPVFRAYPAPLQDAP